MEDLIREPLAAKAAQQLQRQDDESIEERRSIVFAQLKSYNLDLLHLLHSSNSSSSAVSSLFRFLQTCSPELLQPFFDYTLFPLLLLLDASVQCRSSSSLQKAAVGSEKNSMMFDIPISPIKVSDSVTEGVVNCLQELLRKCHLKSVDQMVVLLNKLTYGALLSPSEASEEFREGITKCFRAILTNLHPCTDKYCSCAQVCGLPRLADDNLSDDPLAKSVGYDPESDKCLLTFLRSQTASATVGHWISLLLKAADIEATSGHRGSSRLRIEAFMTLRILAAKVGTTDALAFFLPGVVSQFGKVLHASQKMTSGAAGNYEAINHAIRGLAEYLMIVLHNDANLSRLDEEAVSDLDSSENNSSQHYLEELRKLPLKTHIGDASSEAEKSSLQESQPNSGIKSKSLHVDRSKDWIEKTSAHVNRLLSANFPLICVHPSMKVRRAILAAIEGLLSSCCCTLTESRPMLLECLCALAIDDSGDISLTAQRFLEHIFLESKKTFLKNDIAGIFNRLVVKLPKVVLGSEKALAVSYAQQLLVIIYYSGPQLVLDHLHRSPVTAARFLDVFAACISPNSLFSGNLNKLVLANQSSLGYLRSITELKMKANISDWGISSKGGAALAKPEVTIIEAKESRQKNYELPRMAPWFVNIGSNKLYLTLAGTIRLVGLSLMTDFRNGRLLSLVADILLGHFRVLISELRTKEYNKDNWQTWYEKTGSGQLLRQASTAACILNEMIFGLSDVAFDSISRMFHKFDTKEASVQIPCLACTSDVLYDSLWKFFPDKGAKDHLIDCIGGVLQEYLSPEIWNLPDCKSAVMQPDAVLEDISLHFFQDTAMLHEVIIDGIGISSICLGNDFSCCGFLHSSLYMLLENLSSTNSRVGNASNAVLHLLSDISGCPTVGQLVMENADYLIDSICRQLRHLDLNPRVPDILASMLSYIGVANKILPLLEEPMRSVSLELEILGRHQHPELTAPFLKAIAEITKASKLEALSLPPQAELFASEVRSVISTGRDEAGEESKQDQLERFALNFTDSRRYRQTVGSISTSCITAAIPLLASLNQEACLIALDIIEDGIMALSKVEEAYKCEKGAKEAIEDWLQSLNHDSLDPTEGTDENRLLPSMNKVWPFLVVCIRNKNPVAVRKCLNVISNVVQICGGDFFTRRFHTDGNHFWKLLSVSPFQRKTKFKDEKPPLQLPYRSIPTSLEDSLAETSNMKVQIAALDMIANLCKNKGSSTALHVVLRKVSGLVVGIAYSVVAGLRSASLNALVGLASIDPDLIWLLLADVYYSVTERNVLPPSHLPKMLEILPPLQSSKDYLYVRYGGQSYGFDIDLAAVETVFEMLHARVFTDQMLN